MSFSSKLYSFSIVSKLSDTVVEKYQLLKKKSADTEKFGEQLEATYFHYFGNITEKVKKLDTKLGTVIDDGYAMVSTMTLPKAVNMVFDVTQKTIELVSQYVPERISVPVKKAINIGRAKSFEVLKKFCVCPACDHGTSRCCAVCGSGGCRNQQTQANSHEFFPNNEYEGSTSPDQTGEYSD